MDYNDSKSLTCCQSRPRLRLAHSFLFALSMTTAVLAQPVYTIDLDPNESPVVRGQLDLGGDNPRGDTIAVNNQFIELNGRPFVPIVGEFHYARYPARYWEESIRKMKAGGINVIATYVFWNLHERTEGTFDWSGDLDLRQFVELCEKNGIYAIIRLGPFCHGEIRNGGIPDWLYGRTFEVRSNDPAYLAHVDRLYAAIARQIQGRLFADGGPIIGVQLENEFQHSAAPWEISYAGAAREYTVAERDLRVTHIQVSASEVENLHAAQGRDHMAKLKEIARRHGIVVPLYTATGWGNAAIVERGCIPVTAAYAYPFWAPPSPSPFYLFKDIRKQPDYMPVSYDPEMYPSIPAEIGPGIMTTYARRVRVDPESVAPLIVRTLGSGSNGIGYYMYHGGSTPVFDRFYSEEAGGLPKINYDFQAPIGEFGQLRPHYHTLKLLHLFLESYGAALAPMTTRLPTTNAAITPQTTDVLRWAVRANRNSGFVFMQNFQDHLETSPLRDLQIKVHLAGAGEITWPRAGSFTLPRGASAILPFNLDLDRLRVLTATVQPLTVLRRSAETHHVFFSIEGIPPEIVFEGQPAVVAPEGCTVASERGFTVIEGSAEKCWSFSVGTQRFLVVPPAMALTVWRAWDDRLLFADAEVTFSDDTCELVVRGRESVDVQVYPAMTEAVRVTGARLAAAKPVSPQMSAFRVEFPAHAVTATMQNHGARKVAVRVPDDFASLHDLVMAIDYVGDRCMGFIDGQLVMDHFYFGEPWKVGLRKFADRLHGSELVLIFHPLRRKAAYLDDLSDTDRAAFAPGEDTHLEIKGVRFIPVYKAIVALP